MKNKYHTAPDGFRSKFAWRVQKHVKGERFPRRKRKVKR